MLPVGIAILLGGTLSGATDIAAFPQIWYREVVLGEVAQAAQQYERLFLSPPSDRRPLSTRVRAAFRAGCCFERLGQLDSAILAYRWIESEAARERGPGERDLVSEARLRRRVVEDRLGGKPPSVISDGGTPSEGSPPGSASTAVAVRQLGELVRDTERRLAETLVRLESELGIRGERVAERESLVFRMESLGVHLLLPWAETLPPDLIRDGLRIALPPLPDATRAELESSLGYGAMERALLSLIAGNERRAKDEFQVASAILGSNPLIGAWVERLVAGPPRPERYAELARRHLLDLELERLSTLRRDLRSALDAAEASIAERGRADVAVAHLARIQDAMDWTPTAFRDDVEVREIAGRASRSLESLVRSAGGGWEIGRKLERNRIQRESLIAMAADLLGVLVRDARLGGPADLRGRRDALVVSRGEMDRLLLRARSAEARGGRLAAQRFLRDVETLLAWVPGIDPRSEYRGALENIRRGEMGDRALGERPLGERPLEDRALPGK